MSATTDDEGYFFNMINEEWKDVKNFEGYYEVSNMGNVRRKKSKTFYKDGRVANFSQTVLKPTLNHKGYKRVYLSVNSKKYSKYIHRLVAETFIDDTENKRTVNHINGIKTDNRVVNLEWMTNSENLKHAFHTGLFDNRNKKFSGSGNPSSKLIKEEVLEIRKLKNNGVSTVTLSKMYNISESQIRSIYARRTWKNV